MRFVHRPSCHATPAVCDLINSDPATCARVFDQIAHHTFAHLLKSKLSPPGEVVDYFYCVSFQKRGGYTFEWRNTVVKRYITRMFRAHPAQAPRTSTVCCGLKTPHSSRPSPTMHRTPPCVRSSTARIV